MDRKGAEEVRVLDVMATVLFQRKLQAPARVDVGRSNVQLRNGICAIVARGRRSTICARGGRKKLGSQEPRGLT